MNLLALPALAAVLLTTACGSSGSPAATATPTPAAYTAPSLVADTPPPSMAPAEARAKAAAVLKAADTSFHDEFEKGAALTDGARVDWWTGNGGDAFPVRVATANLKAFSDANQLFTADNEPLSVTDWRDTFSDIPGDVQEWYNSDNGHGYDPAKQAKVEADFAAADQQVANVEAGK